MRRALVGSVLAVVLTAGTGAPALADAPTPAPTSPSASVAAATPAASASPSSTAPATAAPPTAAPATSAPATSAPPASPTPTTTPPSAPASLPVTGSFRDGGALAVDPSKLRWGGAPTAVAVAWLRDGAVVPGAVSKRHALGAGSVGHRLQARVSATVDGTPLSVTSKAKVVQPGVTSEKRLLAALRTTAKTLHGSYTVQVAELDGGKRRVAIAARKHREPASTAKVFIAYATYRSIDAGTLAYGTRLPSGLTVQQCLRAMIEPSDNYCAIELRQRYGTAKLERLVQQQGYTDTHFWYDARGTKTTSAHDVSRLLYRLAHGELLSKASSAAFLKQLKTQVWREAIPPALTDGVVQASKPGELWAPSGMVETDAAIVWGPRSRFVLTIMGADGASTGAITKLAKVVYRELEGPVGTPFVYQRKQMRTTATTVLRASTSRSSRVLARYAAETKVEVIDSVRDRYLVKIQGRTGWVDNTTLTLRHKLL